MSYWECTICGWRVSDVQYLHIVFDPDCPSCGRQKYSEFRFKEDANEQLKAVFE